MKTHGLLFCFLLLAGLSACNTSTQDTTVGASVPVATNDAETVTKPEEPKSPDTAFQIIPGHRAGQIYLGQNPDEVVKALGKPDASNAAMGKALLTWVSAADKPEKQSVTVYTVRKNTGMPDEKVEVRQVRVTSPTFSIVANNLHAGSALSQIKQAYPSIQAMAYYLAEDKSRVYVYDVPPQGIAFEVTGPDSVCIAMTIHPKNKGVQEEYLPLHPDMKPLH
ncbi:hypothetical protein GU926_09960 [Nibribacter ruber]|uniref:Lipoprotein n=1 Tax=Nibribacter ruber TaxID=2698458 RepID=A0A6P1NVJ4_9BACT|nr:hypothetical protein [Nibribacter ruber]QHL87737.1 hypothetical protein GU926_09960 [Nibribacter ruber]